ncbi:MAG: sugar ABC transporter substrate-binding protein [Synechococcus sp. SB0668_bin_15]|nr:sugar ABC transporter substrate-binding protein [Synechococcus sp. SB0668_bin_15]MXZ83818.1 sugar ABC transporter substrate-binding protein [Synechococcus sp. SB0666_bin_14]MYA91438.1 sugar ABC transporter substrate-binding protein [Synechococcus sp. SB0663_bin_10]MYC50276.1 sugar ABC transporter substrate-binding protein [Synechococcus sp. SB0662_bin_14]MYG46571.1 sugar ABC transporter substrate-binding protein [Synechococcus sp. SB0675_bin_6]MYJ59307.1 sugar ABC transporter substrate-bind
MAKASPSRPRHWSRHGHVWLTTLLFPLLLALQSCSARPPARQLEVWTLQLSPKFDAYLKGLVDQWEARNPDVDVRWTDIPWGAVEQKLLAAVFARTAPDVVNLNPKFAANLASRGGLLNLDQHVSPEERERYLEGAWQASTGPMGTFGIPWYLTSRITLVNGELLDAAGYGQPPARWQDLPAFAKAVKDATGRHALFVSVVPEDSAEILESFVQMGVKLLDGQKQAAFNTPAGRRAFSFWTDLYRRDLLPREVVSQGHRRAIELYQSGDVALLSTSAAALNSIRTNAPAVAARTRVAPPLTGPDGSANVAVMNLVVPEQSDQPEEAVDFALFLTNPANQYNFAKASGTLPSADEAIAALKQDVRQAQKDLKPGGEAAAQTLSAQEASLRALERGRVLVPADPEIKQLQAVIYNHLQRAMLGQLSPEEAVETAAAAWNRHVRQSP